MYKYMQVGGSNIPSYSMMIVVGFVICNLIAQRSYRYGQQRYKSFLLLELLGGIGAIIGAKMLSIVKLFIREGVFSLSWNDFSEAGYSYYGGMAGFFIFAYLICKIGDINCQELSKEYMYLLPLLHAFWKVGCLLGGCCYGMEYNGGLAIMYPANVNQMSGISVFPSPMIEAIVSLIISLILFFAKKRANKIDFVGLFLMLYGMTRFILEFFRYHDNSSTLSDGQVYSVICGGIGLYLYISNIRREKL